MESEQQGQNQFFGNLGVQDTISSNQGYDSALQLRLDCNQILCDINDFLNGTSSYQEWDKEKNCNVFKSVKIGDAIANPKGVQAIMLRCRSIFNPQTVQGNSGIDFDYKLYIKFLRQELVMEMIQNRYKWDIDIWRVNDLVDKIMNFAKPFMSRTLNNEERKSYTTSLQSKETHTIQPTGQKSKWGF